MRRLRVRLGFVLGGTLLGLVLGDFLLYGFCRQPGVDYPRGMFVADATCGYQLAPDFRGVMATPTFDTEVATNELGLRSPKLRDRADGHPRLLLIGDSFVFGYAVALEQTIGAFLERELLRELPTIEVLNAGAPGYGPAHELFLLQRLLPELKPDIVIHGFFCGNDIPDVLKLPQTETVFRGFLVSREVPQTYAGSLGALRFEVRRVWEGTQLFRLLEQGRRRTLRAALFNTFASSDDPRADLAWKLVEKCLTDLRGACTAIEVPLLTVALPAQPQVDARLRVAALGGNDLPADQVLWPQKKLAEYASRTGHPFEDVTAAIAERHAAETLYQPLDDHFNGAGNGVVAARIAARLRELGWLGRLKRRS